MYRRRRLGLNADPSTRHPSGVSRPRVWDRPSPQPGRSRHHAAWKTRACRSDPRIHTSRCPASPNHPARPVQLSSRHGPGVDFHRLTVSVEVGDRDRLPGRGPGALHQPEGPQPFLELLGDLELLGESARTADVSGDSGLWWSLLILVATVGLSAIIQRSRSPPRPRLDPRIGQAQRASATATTARTGELPASPEVRTADGVAACAGIEGLTGSASLLVAIVFSALVPPDLWSALLPVTAMTGAMAFRVRRSWVHLGAPHTADRTG